MFRLELGTSLYKNSQTSQTYIPACAHIARALNFQDPVVPFIVNEKVESAPGVLLSNPSEYKPVGEAYKEFLEAF